MSTQHVALEKAWLGKAQHVALEKAWLGKACFSNHASNMDIIKFNLCLYFSWFVFLMGFAASA